jgi:hypothetical protein
MSKTQKLRPFQFRLVTVMVAVTVLATLCGAIRWLFILVRTDVAICVLVALSLVIAFVRSCSIGWWLWRKWDGRRAVRARERESKAIQQLMESAEVQEAIRAAQADQLANPNSVRTEQS